MKKLLIFALAALLIIPALSLAAAPQLVSVHGKLTDTLNNPYTGSKNFIFRIYSAQSGGAPLYTEFWNTTTQQVSLAYGGYFSVLMGSQTSLALPFDQQYWLELSVEGETLSPRYKLGSTPYTYRANITDNLAANANASGNLNMNGFNITNAAYVGIGLSSPSSKLHINQSGSNTLLNASNGTVNSGLYVGALSGGQAGASIGTNSNHQFRLFANGTDALTVDTNGNMGIGTTGSGYKLEIAKSGSWPIIGVTIDASAGLGSELLFKSGSNIVTEFFYDYNTNATYLDSIGARKFYLRANGNNALTVDTNGNVGIGTTAPNASLDVMVEL